MGFPGRLAQLGEHFPYKQGVNFCNASRKTLLTRGFLLSGRGRK